MKLSAQCGPPVSLAAALSLLVACDDGAEESDVQGCTAEAPVGLAPGQVVPNVELSDCAGNALELRDLCPRTAAFIYAFASW